MGDDDDVMKKVSPIIQCSMVYDMCICLGKEIGIS